MENIATTMLAIQQGQTDAAAARATAQTAATAARTAAALAATAAAAPLLDPLATTAPLNRATRAGESAFNQGSSGITPSWTGTIDTFPAFLIAFRQRAVEYKWTATDATGVTTFGGKDLFTQGPEISTADVETAFAARTDPRATQNSQMMYRCLKDSFKGTSVWNAIFGNLSNAPDHEDGPTLWKQMTAFTAPASFQQSQTAMEEIQSLDPAAFDFDVLKINSKLTGYFLLLATPHRAVAQSEQIHHTLTVYGKIQQPSEWTEWVKEQQRNYDKNNITTVATLMNDGHLQYNRIVMKNGAFRGSTQTITEEIVAMLASKKTPKKRTPVATTADGSATSDNKPPPFLRHTKVSSAADAAPYKVGDTKDWNGATYYYCDATTHRNKIHWHTHPTADCRVRKREHDGAAANLGSAAPSPAPTLAPAPSPAPDPSVALTAAPSAAPDITALLVSAYGQLDGRPHQQALLADLLTSIASSE